jgi:hypothetical protein
MENQVTVTSSLTDEQRECLRHFREDYEAAGEDEFWIRVGEDQLLAKFRAANQRHEVNG